MPGAISPNFHEGSRSEYLAQYVLASWGTAVAIPHQEDSGIDLSCTFVDRIGQKAWARLPYSVQVKSTLEPWTFDSEDAIRWFVEHPLPLFFCVVDKASARLRFYHTAPRFMLLDRQNPASSVKLTFGTDAEGSSFGWSSGATAFVVNAPILDFTIHQCLDDIFQAKAAAVLRRWAEIDNDNITRVLNCVPTVRVPHPYTPNEPPVADGIRYKVILSTVSENLLRSFKARFEDSLAFITGELFRRKDPRGTALAMFLFQHLFPDQSFPPIREMTKCWTAGGRAVASVDELESHIRATFAGTTPTQQSAAPKQPESHQ
jgi:hypothetical protein